MLTIQTWRDPYDAGFSTTRPKEIELKPGLTVLIGCNGIGKTTLVKNINDACKNNGIPTLYYDSLASGGTRAMEKALSGSDHESLFLLMSSSEGESVKLNFGRILSKIRAFLNTGFYDTTENRLARAFSIAGGGQNGQDGTTDNRRVLLFDAIDSGLSVDSVAEVRKIFDLILEDAERLKTEAFIVASANEYELARGAHCFDVAAGRYVDIPDYEAYRTFVLKSREKKDRRNEAAQRTMERRAAKERKERRARYDRSPHK